MQLDEALQLERRGATRALTLKVTPLPLPCCLKARLTHLQVLELLLEEEARKTVLALPEADLIAACKSSGLQEWYAMGWGARLIKAKAGAGACEGTRDGACGGA